MSGQHFHHLARRLVTMIRQKLMRAHPGRVGCSKASRSESWPLELRLTDSGLQLGSWAVGEAFLRRNQVAN